MAANSCCLLAIVTVVLLLLVEEGKYWDRPCKVHGLVK